MRIYWNDKKKSKYSFYFCLFLLTIFLSSVTFATTTITTNPQHIDMGKTDRSYLTVNLGEPDDIVFVYLDGVPYNNSCIDVSFRSSLIAQEDYDGDPYPRCAHACLSSGGSQSWCPGITSNRFDITGLSSGHHTISLLLINEKTDDMFMSAIFLSGFVDKIDTSFSIGASHDGTCGQYAASDSVTGDCTVNTNLNGNAVDTAYKQTFDFCVIGPEVCDGKDNDCDGTVDDGVVCGCDGSASGDNDDELFKSVLNYTFSIAKAVPADYDGDGVADIAVYSPGSQGGDWFFSLTSKTDPNYKGNSVGWGFVGAEPVPADYDGDGNIDLGVYSADSGKWYVKNLSGKTIHYNYSFGFPGTIGVPADYDGDGLADVAVYSPGNAGYYIIFSKGKEPTWLNSKKNDDGYYSFGGLGVTPVVGDYDGDGIADLVVYKGDGFGNDRDWALFLSLNTSYILYDWGYSGALPVSMDYDGDGVSDLVVFDPYATIWYVHNIKTGATYSFRYGEKNDVPASADFNGDGADEFAVYRPSNGAFYIKDEDNSQNTRGRTYKATNYVKSLGVCSAFKQVCDVSTKNYINFSSPQNYIPNYESSEISCDGLDNNCDGIIDQSFNLTSKKWESVCFCYNAKQDKPFDLGSTLNLSSSGIISYWPLNGNANDMVGSNDGVIYNLDSNSGKFDSAYSFGGDFRIYGNSESGGDGDGGEDKIVVPDSDSLSFTDGSHDLPFTFSVWVNMSDPTRFRILNKRYVHEGSSPTIIEETEYYFGTNFEGNLTLILGTSSGNEMYVTSTESLSSFANQWTHVLVTYDGSKTADGIHMYVNGSKLKTNSNIVGTYSGMTNTNTDLLIGMATYYEGNGSSNGTIDDVAIFNRTLSDCEIAKLAKGPNACLDECAEIFCDNKDDDNDGLIDENDSDFHTFAFNNTYRPDSTNQNGVCKGSKKICVGGVWSDNYPLKESSEQCDDIDHDCDGNPYNGFECEKGTIGCNNYCNLIPVYKLVCNATSFDEDSQDTLTYQYKWFRVEDDGSLTQIGASSNYYVTEEILNETVFMCEVTACDDEICSLPARKSFTLAEDKNYIPFGVVDVKTSKIGTYVSNEAIPKEIVISSGTKLDYEVDVSCLNGECGVLDTNVLYSIANILQISPLEGLSIKDELLGGETVRARVRLLSDSPYKYSSEIYSTFASKFNLVNKAITKNYTLEGDGVLPESCSTLYHSFFKLFARVSYKNGSETFVYGDDLDFNGVTLPYIENVEKIYFLTNTTFDIPVGIVEVGTTDGTKFTSSEPLVLNNSGFNKNVFNHTINPNLNYGLRTEITSSVEDASKFSDDICLQSKVSAMTKTLSVKINTNCSKGLNNNNYFKNIYTFSMLDGNTKNITLKKLGYDNSNNGFIDDAYLSVSFNLSRMEDNLIGKGLSKEPYVTEFLKNVSLSVKNNIVTLNFKSDTLNETFENLCDLGYTENDALPFDVVVNYSMPNCGLVQNIIPFNIICYNSSSGNNSKNESLEQFMLNETGERVYYWKYGGLNLDKIVVIKEVNNRESLVDSNRIDFEVIEDPNHIIEYVDFDGVSCGGTSEANSNNICYRVIAPGNAKLKVKVDGEEFSGNIINISTSCAYNSISSDKSSLSRNKDNAYSDLVRSKIHLGNLTLSCINDAKKVNDFLCGSFDSEFLSGHSLSVNIIPENSNISINNFVLTVNKCVRRSTSNYDDYATDIRYALNASEVSFCSAELKDNGKFYLPDAHVRKAKCTTTSDLVRNVWLKNHILSYLKSGQFDNNNYLSYTSKNNFPNLIDSINEILENEDVKMFFKDNSNNPVSIPSKTDTSLITVFSFSELRKNYIESKLKCEGVECLAKEDFVDVMLESNSDLKESNSNIKDEITNFMGKNSEDDVNSDYSDLVASLISKIMHDPGFYYDDSSSDYAFCTIDYNESDVACCSERDMCVYGGSCYEVGETMDTDLDLVVEKCEGS